MLKRVILYCAVLAVAGCATTMAHPSSDFASSWTGDRCQKLLDQRDALLWAVAFGGGLTGAGSVSTAFPEDTRKDLRLGLGISSAIIAATATSLSILAKNKSAEFEQYCNAEPAPIVATIVEDEPDNTAEDDIIYAEFELIDGGI